MKKGSSIKGNSKKAKENTQFPPLFFAGHLFGDSGCRAKIDAEIEARLKEEKDKEFEPLDMPIAPVEPEEGFNDVDYSALYRKYSDLKEEYAAIKKLRSQIGDKRSRAYFSKEEIAEKDEEAARRFAAYKADCEAYSKRHEEVYSFRRLACEAVRYLSKIADSLDNIESSVSSIEDSVEE